MRCPYCGSLNLEKASFCTTCGRNLKTSAPTPPDQQAPNRQPTRPPYPQPTRPAQTPPRPSTPQPPPSPPPAAPAVPPPEHFPPRTMEHLAALEQSALSYTIVEETESVGRKKLMRILFARCTPWQQMGTLLKAYKEQRAKAEQFDTLVIQGVLSKNTDAYRFTNGQLCVDRNVRLGERVQNRYQIETSNGFDSDAVRAVLYE